MGNLKELVYLLLKNKHVISVLLFFVFFVLAYLSALCEGAEAWGQGIISLQISVRKNINSKNCGN